MTATRRRVVLALLLGLSIPTALPAQDVSTMVARVRAEGAPAAGVVLSVYIGGERRELATTGASGLAVIEFGRVPLEAGSRLGAFAVRCGEVDEIVFARSAAALPLRGEGCMRSRLGTVVWARTDRLDVQLGDAPVMAQQAAETVVSERSGLRIQLGPVLSFVGGDEIANIGTGFGGELMIGFDARSGFGLGGAFSGSRHGLEGVNESLWRWAATFEPRYTIDRPDWEARPYLLARAARQWLDAEAGSGLATESGWSFGGGVGIVFPLVADLSADLSAHFASLSVDAQGFDRSGTLLTVGGAVRF